MTIFRGSDCDDEGPFCRVHPERAVDFPGQKCLRCKLIEKDIEVFLPAWLDIVCYVILLAIIGFVVYLIFNPMI